MRQKINGEMIRAGGGDCEGRLIWSAECVQVIRLHFKKKKKMRREISLRTTAVIHSRSIPEKSTDLAWWRQRRNTTPVRGVLTASFLSLFHRPPISFLTSFHFKGHGCLFSPGGDGRVEFFHPFPLVRHDVTSTARTSDTEQVRWSTLRLTDP